MTKPSVRIAPSILSADFARLADEVAKIEAAGADFLHIDVMDGHFVPNLTVGPPIVEALRKVTKLTLDVHLMMTNPDAFIPEFVEAGADYLTVHVEACPHLHRTENDQHARGVELRRQDHPHQQREVGAQVAERATQLVAVKSHPSAQPRQHGEKEPQMNTDVQREGNRRGPDLDRGPYMRGG